MRLPKDASENGREPARRKSPLPLRKLGKQRAVFTNFWGAAMLHPWLISRQKIVRTDDGPHEIQTKRHCYELLRPLNLHRWIQPPPDRDMRARRGVVHRLGSQLFRMLRSAKGGQKHSESIPQRNEPKRFRRSRVRSTSRPAGARRERDGHVTDRAASCAAPRQVIRLRRIICQRRVSTRSVPSSTTSARRGFGKVDAVQRPSCQGSQNALR